MLDLQLEVHVGDVVIQLHAVAQVEVGTVARTAHAERGHSGVNPAAHGQRRRRGQLVGEVELGDGVVVRMQPVQRAGQHAIAPILA
ncbi:hypothetical protein B8W90_12410, partial [Staphylococcus hominis]